MSELDDVLALFRSAMVAVERSLKVIGEAAQDTTERMAEKIRVFRDGHDDGEGGGDAAQR